MKKTALVLVVVSCCFVGCIKPYHEPVLVDINTHEIPFLINQEDVTKGESQGTITDEERQAQLKENLVQSRRIEIHHRWKKTGYLSHSGKWIPTQRIILVDTSPETREWVTSSNKGTSHKDEGIWVESSDSVGFSTGISCTARIESQEDAVLFLGNYPPKSTRVVKSADGRRTILEVDVTKLSDIMDTELRTRIQAIYADECGKYPMDELREKKQELMTAVKEDVIPYFSERGITITTIGQFGGFTYENPDIQSAIDKVFQAQQDEEVAKAEAKAAEQRKSALQLEGEGEAAKILEVRRGESEGIKLVADAKAYEIEKMEQNPEMYLQLKWVEIEQDRLKVWDGKYPTYLFQTGSESNTEMPKLLLNMPTVSQK